MTTVPPPATFCTVMVLPMAGACDNVTVLLHGVLDDVMVMVLPAAGLLVASGDAGILPPEIHNAV